MIANKPYSFNPVYFNNVTTPLHQLTIKYGYSTRTAAHSSTQQRIAAPNCARGASQHPPHPTPPPARH